MTATRWAARAAIVANEDVVHEEEDARAAPELIEEEAEENQPRG